MVNLPVIAAPWSLLTGIGAVLSWQTRHVRLRWPLVWLCLTVLIFSVPGQKKNAYLLPETVAITLLGAAAGDWILRELHRNLRTRGPRALKRLRAATAAVIVTMILIVSGGVLVIEPVRQAHRSPVPFAQEVDTQAQGQEIIAAGYVDEEVLFYLRSPIRYVSGTEVSTLPDRPGLLILGEESMLRDHQLRERSEILVAGRKGHDSLRFIRLN
jgi:4-amino-4-deoxy-L-arabinose transferase-like glycosyltransferase